LKAGSEFELRIH